MYKHLNLITSFDKNDKVIRLKFVGHHYSTKVSDRTALNNLNQLIERNIILAQDKKKCRYYMLQ